MNAIYLLFVSEIVLFIISGLLSDGDIMAPSIIMCSMFIISTFCTIISINNWGVQYGLDSYLVLTIGLLTFILSEFMVRHFVESNARFSERTIKIEPKPILLHWIILGSIMLFDIIVLIRFYFEIKRIVLGYGQNTYGSQLFSNYRQIITSIVTEGDAQVGLTGFFLNQFVKMVEATGYISLFIFMNNILIENKKKKQILWHILIITCTLLLYLIQGERGAILQLATAGLIDWYILWHRKNGWDINNSIKMVKIGVVIIAVGIPSFYLSLVILGRSTNKNLLEYTCFYIGSGIQLFDLYMKSPAPAPILWGEESLIGVHRFLNAIGFKVPIRNPHLEMRSLNSYTHSNIYTFFRRPFHDFGFWGMLVFTVVISSLFAWIYYKKIKYKHERNTIYWILLYSELFYWIVCTPIDQLSQTMFSVYEIAKIILIFSGYYFFTKLSENLLVRNQTNKLNLD